MVFVQDSSSPSVRPSEDLEFPYMKPYPASFELSGMLRSVYISASHKEVSLIKVSLLLSTSTMSVLFNHNSHGMDDDEGPLVMRISVAFICLSGTAVFLRYLARRVTRNPWSWDDWMIVVALMFAWTNPILEIIGIFN